MSNLVKFSWLGPITEPGGRTSPDEREPMIYNDEAAAAIDRETMVSRVGTEFQLERQHK